MELGLLLGEVFDPATPEGRRVELMGLILPHLAQKLTDETLRLLLDLLAPAAASSGSTLPHRLVIEHLPLREEATNEVSIWPLVAVILAELDIPVRMISARPDHPLLERLIVDEGISLAPLENRLPEVLRPLWRRPELTGMRTLALLAHPPGERLRLVGVGSSEWAPLIAQAAQGGGEKVYVISGREGRDYASAASPSRGMFVMGELIFSLEVEPERLGVADHRFEELSPADQWAALERLLAGDETSPLVRPLALNAALALELAGRVASFAEGIDLALKLIIQGRLRRWFSPNG